MIDSFAEGMAKLKLAESMGRSREYKFCVIHLFHFIELYLKYSVWLQDRDAVFSGREKRRTISADQAIKYLESNGCEFRNYLKGDFSWLKQLRNNILHYEVSIDIKQWRFRISRILFLIDLLNRSCKAVKFESDLPDGDWEQYLAIVNRYSRSLGVAVDSIIREHEAAKESGFPVLYRCKNCDNHTITKSGMDGLFTCHFCGSRVPIPNSEKQADNYFCIISIPDQYRMETRRVEIKPEGCGEIKTDSGIVRVRIPAEYKYVSEKRLVSPARYVAMYAG